MSGGKEKGGFWSDLPTLLGAVAVALAIRTFLVQPFYVPSDSMLPTLLVGDHVFVNKFLFGAGLTGTDVRFPGVREPKRGEVIVFQFARAPNGSGIFPADQRPDLPRDAFVKRLIGVPGDRVAIVEGQLVINGEVVPRERAVTWCRTAPPCPALRQTHNLRPLDHQRQIRPQSHSRDAPQPLAAADRARDVMSQGDAPTTPARTAVLCGQAEWV